MQNIRSGDKKHLRKVVIHIDVMIAEGAVLFRVKNFEESSTRITSEVTPELIDFVQQDHRIDRSRTLHQLNDLARKGSGVSTTMSPYLGFVVNAAKRKP